MRKLLLALFVMFFMAGLVIAAEVTSAGYDKDKKEWKVKEGDAEKTYKITDKTKFTVTDPRARTGRKSRSKTSRSGPRARTARAGAKFEIKADKDEVTEVTWKSKK